MDVFTILGLIIGWHVITETEDDVEKRRKEEELRYREECIWARETELGIGEEDSDPPPRRKGRGRKRRAVVIEEEAEKDGYSLGLKGAAVAAAATYALDDVDDGNPFEDD